jgi:hypothetical protein
MGERCSSCRSSVDLNQTMLYVATLDLPAWGQHIGKSFVLASVLTYIDKVCSYVATSPCRNHLPTGTNFFTCGRLSRKT